MSEKKSMTVVTVTPEPKRTKSGKDFWLATDSEDREWLVWEKAIAEAVRERKLAEQEYDVYETTDDQGRPRRTINGIPGVIEGSRGGGGGGRKTGAWRPKTPDELMVEEAARWPSMVLAYAKDLATHAGVTDASVITAWHEELVDSALKQAERLLPWMRQLAKTSTGGGEASSATQIARGAGVLGEVAPAPSGNEMTWAGLTAKAQERGLMLADVLRTATFICGIEGTIAQCKILGPDKLQAIHDALPWEKAS